MMTSSQWMQMEMDLILFNEVIECEWWLEHLPFLHVTKKEWRSKEFWGSGNYLFKPITDEEWVSQPRPPPCQRQTTPTTNADEEWWD